MSFHLLLPTDHVKGAQNLNSMTTLTKHNKYSHGLIEDDAVEILPHKHFDRHLVPVFWKLFTREMLLSRNRNIAV